MPPAGDHERAGRLSHINGNARLGLQGLAIYRRGTRRTSSSEAQPEAERAALGALLGDKASAEGGCGEPAVRAQHGHRPRSSPRLERSARLSAVRAALGVALGVKASAEGGSRDWATRVQRPGDQARDAPA